MGICRSLCHSFNFVNMRFIVKVIFFPIKFYKKLYFHGKFITDFVVSFFILTYVPLNKFVFTENNDLPCLIKQESYSSPHCIFQSVHALNKRSIKILRRCVVKELIAPQ